jgi:hypothetical protein
MTGDIPPCRAPAVVDPGDPHRRQGQQGQPRRPKPSPQPPRPHHDGGPGSAEIPDPANPPYIGTHINVRV